MTHVVLHVPGSCGLSGAHWRAADGDSLEVASSEAAQRLSATRDSVGFLRERMRTVTARRAGPTCRDGTASGDEVGQTAPNQLGRLRG